ncbi:hypothetical protein MMC12_007913 [Toensbergia leucococca]|nr:hypothetical protein [Toensbergia leucococca]
MSQLQINHETPRPAGTSSEHPKQLSLPLPLSPHTTLHIQITRLETSLLVFLTTTDPSNSAYLSALGSFVYAMPNRFQVSEPLSTSLYAVPGSIDFATRVAKILARKTGNPAYVGCSVVFGGATVEEEIQGVKVAVDTIIKAIEED